MAPRLKKGLESLFKKKTGGPIEKTGGANKEKADGVTKEKTGARLEKRRQ